MIIPLCEPDLTGNEEKYLSEAISSGFVSSVGKFVTQFEDMLCKSTKAQYAVAVNSGTSALHLALLAIGVKANDLVITPSFTFIATANAVSYCGAENWLFDITQDDWNINPILLEDELKENLIFDGNKYIHKTTKQKISALIVVYANGMPAQMQQISDIANKYNIPIIADAAAAIGCRYNSCDLGDITQAKLTTLSFNGNKIITCGGGGAVISNNKQLSDKIRHLSTTAKETTNYDHDEIGFNYRMTNIQAAVGVAQLERLEYFLNKKQYIFNYYKNILYKHNGLKSFPTVKNSQGSNWLSGIILDKKHDIDKLHNQLNEKGVLTKPFWKPMHLQKPYINALRTNMDVCKNLWRRILILPSSVNLTDDKLDYIAESVVEELQSADK